MSFAGIFMKARVLKGWEEQKFTIWASADTRLFLFNQITL